MGFFEYQLVDKGRLHDLFQLDVDFVQLGFREVRGLADVDVCLFDDGRAKVSYGVVSEQLVDFVDFELFPIVAEGTQLVFPSIVK